MVDLQKEIGRLARELQGLEQLLVEECGIARVTPRVPAGLPFRWPGRLNPFSRDAWRWVSQVFNSGELAIVRAPQPD
jgi:hypothetical protein